MKKRNIIILVILMVIGFAAVSTTLYINGAIGIGADQLGFEGDVIFTKAETEDEGFATIEEGGKEITYISKVLRDLNETSVLDFEVSNYSRQYDAKVKISCMVDEKSSYAEYLEINEEMLLNDGEDELTKNIVPAGTRKSGKITTTLVKTYAGSLVEEENEDIQSITITCTLHAEGTERDELADELTDGPVVVTGDGKTVGDQIKIANEYFYVIGEDKDNLILLSKYNINLATNTQFDAITDYERYAFSEDINNDTQKGYWHETDLCPSYPCDLSADTNITEQKIALYAAMRYGKKFKLTGRLITIEELEKLVKLPATADIIGKITAQDSDIDEKLLNIVIGPHMLGRSLNYWVDAAYDYNGVYAIDGVNLKINGPAFNKKDTYGIRPVLELPKSLIKEVDLNDREYEVLFFPSIGEGTIIEEPIEIAYGKSKTLTAKPEDGYEVINVYCTNGYTANIENSDETTREQRITFLNNNIDEESECVVVFDTISPLLTANDPVGTEVKYKDEKFFVIKNEGDTITLLSKYVLKVAQPFKYAQINWPKAQDSKFSETNYWTGKMCSSSVSSCDLANDTNITSDKLAMYAAKVYGEKLGSKGRLMTKTELGKLVTIASTRKITGKEDMLKIVLGEDKKHYYWLATNATSDGTDIINIVQGPLDTLARLTYNHAYGARIRPVIEISKSALAS